MGVSGGLDSMALLHLLSRAPVQSSCRLIIAHFNHMLRGDESDADETFVANQANQLGLDFIAGRGDVARLAKERGFSIEMAARHLRHDFFAREAFSCGAAAVALAHHLDDQIESFFLKLFRGNTGEGLAGMRWKTRRWGEIEIIRPLLSCSKEELKAWVAQELIPYREDSSNAQNEYLRNKLRNQVLPRLREDFPHLPAAVQRWQAVVGEEKRFVIEQAANWLGGINQQSYVTLHLAIQREVIHQQLVAMGLSFDFEVIEKLRLHPIQPILISKDVMVARQEDGRLTILPAGTPAEPFQTDSVQVFLSQEPQRFTFGGKELVAQWVPSSQFRMDNHAEYFDAGNVGASFTLRYWRPGDRYQPIGMDQLVKLQDLFTNAKIDRAARRHLLVAEAANGEIFWVERLRISEKFKVAASSSTLLKLSLIAPV
ncbi:MAG: tRNA lysidine(34) synthetase TilS [Verrucomicrobiales bacterium]